MKPELEKMAEMVKGCVDEAGLFCLEANVHPQKRQAMIDVIVDTVEGVTLDQCAIVSRAIAKKIDEAFPEELYELHVGSPGIDRPLEFDWQFKKNTGRMAHVVLDEEGVNRSVDLRLAGIDGDTVKFTEKNGTAVAFKRSDILHLTVRPEIGSQKTIIPTEKA